MKYQLEICANSITSAINAEEGGADRIELCDNLWEGGTTPSLGTLEVVKSNIRIPVFVLVRPRGGDFVYTDLEFEVMKQDIVLSKKKKADGIVSGVLLPDGRVDIERTKELVKLSCPLPFTFHRAFDLTPDPMGALEDVIHTEAKRILTSGQQTSALEGVELLSELISKSEGRISILAGGGITIKNIDDLINLGVTEFHLSAKSASPGLANYSNKVPMNSSGDIPEDKLIISDVAKIKEIRKHLNENDSNNER